MENNNSCKIRCLERIQGYPVMAYYMNTASHYYTWIKEKNSMLNTTLTWTENNVKSAINIIEPIAVPRLGKVDNFACNQLDNIENKYPIIKETPENLLKSSSEYYDSSIKPRVVNLIKTPFVLVKHPSQYLLKTTDNFVNRFMTRSGARGTESTEKMQYNILLFRAMNELATIYNFTKKNVEGLSNMLFAIYNQHVTKNRDLINKYYQHYADKVISDDEHAPSDPEVLRLVRILSLKLLISMRAMTMLFYNHMDANNQEKLDLLFTQTERMYTAVSEAIYIDILEKLPMAQIKQVRQITMSLLSTFKDMIVMKYKTETGQSAETKQIDVERTKDQESNYDTDYFSITDEEG